MGAQNSSTDIDTAEEEDYVELEDLGLTFLTTLDFSKPVTPGRAYVFALGKDHAVWAVVFVQDGRRKVQFSASVTPEEEAAARAYIREDLAKRNLAPEAWLY